MNTKNKKKTKYNQKNLRIAITSMLFGIFVIYIIFSYAKISIIKGEEYRKLALEQLTKSYKGNNNRGEILDDEGVKIAVNIPAFTIWAIPDQYRENKAPTELVAKLVEILEMEPDYIREKLNGKSRSKIISKVKS